MRCNAKATIYRHGIDIDECYNLTQNEHDVVCADVSIFLCPEPYNEKREQQGGVLYSSKPRHKVFVPCDCECVRVGDLIDITDCTKKTQTYCIEDTVFACGTTFKHWVFTVEKVNTSKPTNEACYA